MKASLLSAQGFTLIELLIAMALFAFLVMLAGPMYTQYMANSQIRNAAEISLDGVRLAQAQAVKRNSLAQFVLTPNVGWTAQVADEDNPGNFLLIQQYLFQEGASRVTETPHPDGATTVTFNGLGRVVANPDTSASLTWIGMTNATATRPLNLVINVLNAGLGTSLKVCDPDGGVAATDPRHCPALP